MKTSLLAILLVTLSALIACDGKSTYVHKDVFPPLNKGVPDKDDPPMVVLGERFFREGRFSQYFYANAQGSFNQLPKKGDPVVDTIETLEGMYKSPYRGQGISCAACHFVDQAYGQHLGVRAYTDFSIRSRIPDRGDGQERTVRNSPNMVAMSLKDGMFLHHDGEFATPEDLARAGFLGRNMGWLADESETAIRHIAQVVRYDNGKYPTETDVAGFSYAELFSGSKRMPRGFRLPANLRMDVTKATDDEIFNFIVKMTAEYLRSLDYMRDLYGNYVGTPYDQFLRKNSLPLGPAQGESAKGYSERLFDLINNLKNPIYVTVKDNRFYLHNQPFVFQQRELEGLKVFFTNGKCISCHTAPDFTDHLFHNTGVAQDDYDRVHGSGSFMKLKVPRLGERNANAGTYLPPTTDLPKAKALLRSVPTLEDPSRADLGVWVVFANPAMPKPQGLLRKAICQSLSMDCSRASDEELLDLSLGMFKTPSVRDLGQSGPYLHTGSLTGIEEVMGLYQKYGAMARAGLVRNPDPVLAEIQLTKEDRENLTAFLKSLNEDYR